MSSLVIQSEKLVKQGDQLLLDSKLPIILGKFGQIRFVGSYAAKLMMHGDIDIHVLRDKEFSKQETLNIFNEIVSLTKFNSYYIGDWNDTNAHPEFPHGYYTGLKIIYADTKWKIDIWFLSIAEQNKFDEENMDITKVILTEEQRESILKFKQYRNENKIKISGQEIYEIVLNKGILKIEEFRLLLTNRSSK